MTEPNAENALAVGTVDVWLANLADDPALPTAMSDLDTLGDEWVDLGHTTTDNLSVEASQDVQQRMSAKFPKNVPFRIDRYFGPLTLGVDALEVTRESLDAAFGGGTYGAPGGDGSVKWTPAATGIKNFAAIVRVNDGENSLAFVLQNSANINAKTTLAAKQGDMLSLPLQLQSIGVTGNPWGWYVVGDAPGFATGS